MRLSKFTVIAGLSAIVANVQAIPTCGSVSTVFVTVTATRVTQIATSSFETPPSVAEIPELHASAGITKTVTDNAPFFKVTTAIPTTAVAENGPFYYTEDNGTTHWLYGKTPPAGKKRVTRTIVITVEPIPPTSTVINGVGSESTSYSSVLLTVAHIEYQPNALTKIEPPAPTAALPSTATISSSNAAVTPSSVPLSAVASSIASTPALIMDSLVASISDLITSTSIVTIELIPVTPSTTAGASAFTTAPNVKFLSKSFSGLGSSGWNSTLTALPKEHTAESGAEGATQFEVDLQDNIATPQDKVSLAVLPSYSNNATYHLKPRQLGSIVTATIEGIVVSWTNEYAGVPSLPPAPVTTSSSVVFQEDIAAPTVSRMVVPIYPWGLQPVPVPTDFEGTLTLTLPIARSKAPTTIATSFVPALLANSVASHLTPTATFRDESSTSKRVVSAVPSYCNSKAEFIIDFDDLPYFGGNPGTLDTPPIINPYRKLFFSGYWGYGPEPSVPFEPVSSTRLGICRAVPGLNIDGSPDAALELFGEFGAGPRARDSTYWLHAFSLWVGCENGGPSHCVITINGYAFFSSTRVASQTITLPPCPGLVNCKMTFVDLDDDFRNLSGIQILAAVGQQLVTYFVDDVSLGWSNNTCEAQKKRSSRY